MNLPGANGSAWRVPGALVNSPSIVLADEADRNLDSKTGDEILALFRELIIIREIRSSLVTHEHDIAHTRHRIIFIRDGRSLRPGRERVTFRLLA